MATEISCSNYINLSIVSECLLASIQIGGAKLPKEKKRLQPVNPKVNSLLTNLRDFKNKWDLI